MNDAPTPDTVRVRASGKVNLALRVGPRRHDGYHPLATVFQSVGVFDDVEVAPARPGEFPVSITGPQSDLVPADGSNLVVKAARLLAERYHVPDAGAEIAIRKSIPVTGGMAGGSADCAAALLALSVLWDLDVDPAELSELGAALGADVPFALHGQTAFGTGRGDRLVPVLTRGTYQWVLALADFELSTPAVFRRFDELHPDPDPDIGVPDGMLEALASGDAAALAPTLVNDLAGPALSLRPELGRTMEAGLQAGALAAMLSGSGPTVAFLASGEEAAIDLSGRLNAANVCRAVRRVSGPVHGARLVA